MQKNEVMFKILQIIPDLKKGGAQRLVIDICNELRDKKIAKVLIVYFFGKNEFVKESLFLKCKKIDIDVKLSIIAKSKINIEHLQKEINKFSPDIIHSHLYLGELYSSLCNLNGAKWFSHVHGFAPQYNSNKRIKNRITYNFERKIIMKNKSKLNFIAVSEAIESFLKNFLKNSNPIYKLQNAVNLKNYKPRKQQKKYLSLITIGSLVKNKNHIFLLRVVKYISLKRACSIIIVGDGPEKEKLEKFALKFNLNSIFTGNVDDVSKYLTKADIYVHASKKEAFGLTLIEAMACGKVVISLDGKGNSELIKDGVNGFLINEENIEKFAEKILSCYDNQDLYEKISKEGLKTSYFFNIEKYVQNLVKIYRD